MHIVYVVEVVDSAFPSQVIEVLIELAKREKVSRIDLVVGVTEPFKFNISSDKIFIHTFKRGLVYPVLAYVSIMRLARVLKLLDITPKTIFHCRGEVSSYFLFKSAGLIGIGLQNVITDVRGAVVEEVRDFLRLGAVSRYLKLILFSDLKSVYSKSSGVTCVSNALREYLINKFDVKKSKIKVVPCCAGISFEFLPYERSRIRKRLNIADDEILCVFATGGDFRWQNEEAIFRPLGSVACKILFISKNKINGDNVISLSANYSEMPGLLSAADFGVMIRDRSIVNEVASPIKISEYLACGLPVVVNRSVESVVSFVDKTGYGVVLDDNEVLDFGAVDQLKHMDRISISREAIDTYGVVQVSETYIDFYSELLSKESCL